MVLVKILMLFLLQRCMNCMSPDIVFVSTRGRYCAKCETNGHNVATACVLLRSKLNYALAGYTY